LGGAAQLLSLGIKPAMSRFAQSSRSLIAILVVFTGCMASTQTNAPTASIRPDMARLTQEQAIQKAQIIAIRNGYLLTNYKEPDVFREVHYGFRSEFIYWHIGFESKFSFPDDHFTVDIDDQTHKVDLVTQY
jgi:hypothetical protein